MKTAYENALYLKVVMMSVEKTKSSGFDIRATRSMIELSGVSICFVLSPAAKDFIEQNDLGEFSIRFDDAEDWLMIAAPSDEARVLFRLAFS